MSSMTVVRSPLAPAEAAARATRSALWRASSSPDRKPIAVGSTETWMSRPSPTQQSCGGDRLYHVALDELGIFDVLAEEEKGALLLVPWVLTLRRGGLVAGGSSRRG